MVTTEYPVRDDEYIDVGVIIYNDNNKPDGERCEE